MTRILFLGDVYLPAPVESRLALPEHLVYNLEYPITDHPVGWPGKVNLRAAADHAAATFGRRPDAVCLANNHVLDFGPEGFADTVRALDAAGVAAFGAGTEADGYRNPAVLDAGGGRRVALLGYACPSSHPVFAEGDRPGAARLDAERVAADVAAARAAGADRVVVQLHWGIEECPLPTPADVLLGRRIVDAGADLVIGHHAHCAQPYERHGGCAIFYGLGNAVFPDLAEPSDFGPDGRARNVFRKRQQPWNRRSLGVLYDPATNAVEVRRLHFDGRTVVDRGPDAGGELRYEGAEGYAARFRRAYRWATLRDKALRFLSDPKLPRPRHLRSLARIVTRESRYGG